MKIFITSDNHWGHTNIIKYCKRPFINSDEMNKAMIDNWNSVIDKNDIVYHLGDFIVSRTLLVKDILPKLNGKIHLLCGSHDKTAWREKDLFYRIYQRNNILEIKHKNIPIVMSHCPMLSWEKRSYGSIHFFGHVHTSPHKNVLCQKNSYDVGVDNNNFTPLLLDDAIEKARNNPSSFSINNLYDEDKNERIS